MGDGRRANPSCRRERAEQQDLGLDASSHFSSLAFINGLLLGGSAFVPLPLQPFACAFSFNISQKVLGFFTKKKSAVQLLNGVHEPTSTEETLRASGCWAQNSFKDWNESEDLWPLQEF